MATIEQLRDYAAYVTRWTLPIGSIMRDRVNRVVIIIGYDPDEDEYIVTNDTRETWGVHRGELREVEDDSV